MNRTRQPLALGRSVHVGTVIAFVALAMAVPAGVAQTPQAAMGDEAHPVHIHSGTCAELGDVVVPLADVTVPEGEHAGADSAHPLKLSLNVIDMPLQELLDGEYAPAATPSMSTRARRRSTSTSLAAISAARSCRVKRATRSASR